MEKSIENIDSFQKGYIESAYGELGLRLPWNKLYANNFKLIVDQVFKLKFEPNQTSLDYSNRLQQFLGLGILLVDYQLSKVDFVREDLSPLDKLDEFFEEYPSRKEWHYFTGFSEISPFEKSDFRIFFRVLSHKNRSLILNLIEDSIGHRLKSRKLNQVNKESLVEAFERPKAIFTSPLETRSFYKPTHDLSSFE